MIIDGKPVLLTYTCKPNYIKTELFKDENGNQCESKVEIQATPVEHRDFTLDNGQWQKYLLLFKNIEAKKIFRPMPNSVNFESTDCLVLQTYSVSPQRCLECSESGEDYDYLKFMPDSGVYKRCFKTDVTTWFPCSKANIKHGFYRLLSEVVISPKEATDLLQSHEAYCGSIALRQQLLGKT